MKTKHKDCFFFNYRKLIKAEKKQMPKKFKVTTHLSDWVLKNTRKTSSLANQVSDYN